MMPMPRQRNSESIEKGADRIKSEKMLQAKERFIKLKSEHEKVIFQRKRKSQM